MPYVMPERKRFVKPFYVPTSLEELHGPKEGTVVLPLSVNWTPDRDPFDLAKDEDASIVYYLVLNEGGKEEVEGYLDRDILIRLWPTLFATRDVVTEWQRRFPELRGGRSW